MSPDTARDQAEAFLSWQKRSGGPFKEWAHTKGFTLKERGEILAVAADILLSPPDDAPDCGDDADPLGDKA